MILNLNYFQIDESDDTTHFASFPALCQQLILLLITLNPHHFSCLLLGFFCFAPILFNYVIIFPLPFRVFYRVLSTLLLS